MKLAIFMVIVGFLAGNPLLCAQSPTPPADVPSNIRLLSIRKDPKTGERYFLMEFPISPDHDALAGGIDEMKIELKAITGNWKVADITSKELMQKSSHDGPIFIMESMTQDKTREAALKFAVGDLATSEEFRKTINIAGGALPPKETVLSTGMIHRNTGAFFRFRRTVRHEIESQTVVGMLLKTSSKNHREAFIVIVEAKGKAGLKRSQEYLLFANAEQSEIGDVVKKQDELAAMYHQIVLIRNRMNSRFQEYDAARNNLSFPLLGYGTKSAENLKAAEKAKLDYHSALNTFRNIDKKDSLIAIIYWNEKTKQAEERYLELTEQAEEFRASTGFPYFMLGSAAARAQTLADKARAEVEDIRRAMKNEAKE